MRRAALLAALLLAGSPWAAAQTTGGDERVGVPVTGTVGVPLTTEQLMARQAAAPERRGVRLHPEHEVEGREDRPQNPLSPNQPAWPPSGEARARAPQPYAPQTLGIQFTGATLTDTGAFPPDTMGTVGPSQFIVAVNGRLRSFNKATGLADGVLNFDTDVFFASVMTPPVAGEVVFTSDPRIRYDRLSGRWIIVMLDVILNASTGAITRTNRVLLAVSDAASGGVVSGATVWTFFFFDAGATFDDYPTLGVDASALYIGTNVFSIAGSFTGCNGYVVRKTSALGAGPIVVTTFAGIVPSAAGAGPYTPQGVDNIDAAAAEGYFIGVDNATFGTLMLRRVSTPGGTPTISGNLAITVPTTSFPVKVSHLGNTGGNNGRLDALDDRLFAAVLRNGRLWTAHNISIHANGTVTAPFSTRNAARWYELQSLTATPSLVQSGTVFDATLPDDANQLNYWIPSIMVSGQGHAAMGFSHAGAAARINAATMGRLAGDAAGMMQGSPVLYTAASSAYNPPADPGGAGGRRWGDYSYTSLDPNDDMTMWTIQEFTSSANLYGVRAVKLIAPPPATPNCGTPAVVTASTQDITITGTSTAGSGFYDPGAGFANRLQASVSGGVTVNSVTYNNPTSVTLNVTVTTNGLKDVTLTNPDGQAVVGTGCINVNVGASADLSITKTDGQASEVPGTSVTYTIVALNAGPSTATGATITDTLPGTLSGATWNCTGGGGGTCTASGSGNITDTVNLPVGGTVTYTLTGTISAAATGSLGNTAMVAPPGGVTDPTPGNNSATDTDTLAPQSDLSITKTDGQTSTTTAATVTYTIVAANAGPSVATGATVSDTVAAALTGVTWTCLGAGGGTCSAGGSGSISDTVNLPVGATVTYTLTGTVAGSATSPLVNTATVAAPGGSTDPTPGNNSATDSDTVLFVCGTEIVAVPDGRLTEGVMPAGATRWFGGSLRIGNAYSVEFRNLTGGVPPGALTVFAGDDGCGGTSSLASTVTSDVDPAGTGGIVRASFTATGTATFFRARLVNDTGGTVGFSFGWSDTTLFSPAWSTNGSFNTFYSFQNTTAQTVNGTLRLLDAAGVELSSFPVVVPPGQTTSLNTATLGVARNRTGTARFVHDGPPGAVVAESAIANFNLSPAYVQPVKFVPVRDGR